MIALRILLSGLVCRLVGHDRREWRPGCGKYLACTCERCWRVLSLKEAE